MKSTYARQDVDNAWCPGCGNFGILNILKMTLDELEIDKHNVVFVSGIGQAAKTPYYLDVHMFDGLHGRALPVATAIKMVNPSLAVVAEGGDGDMYGEGGNHFLNAIRRNINIVHVVHNNMVYGLTKGQASPTSQKEFKTKVQIKGVGNEPFNPLSVALALNASFVSRVYMGNVEHTKKILKAAFLHPGYALVDIFQPCVVFNAVNTYEWFRDNSYILDESAYDASDKNLALAKAMEKDPYALGILYQEMFTTFEERLWNGYEKQSALFANVHPSVKLQSAFNDLK